MSNAGLYAERNRLERELADIRYENAKLQREVDQAVGTIDSLRQQLVNYENNVNNTLAVSESKMNNSIAKADTALGLQQQIEVLYPLYMNIEEADKRNRQLQQKIYYDFKDYRIIRKIMQGIMDNLDLSLVSEEIIYKAVEKEHLQAPDFWLTSAMLAVMAWKADNREIAERAIKNSLSLDIKNTCMFFMIFNLRMGREAAALNWMSVYEQQEIKGEDYKTILMMFSLVSKTVFENISTNIRVRLEAFVDRILKESMAKESFSDEGIINLIRERMIRTRTRQDFDCPALRKHTNAYEYLAETMSFAENNSNILDWICTIVNPKTNERNAYLKHYMDNLIASPNAVEKETYDEMKKNDYIVECHGNKADAEIRFAQEMHRMTQDINLIAEMVKTVHDNTEEEVNAQMRRNMFVILKDYEKRGYISYLNNYRARTNSRFSLTIQDYKTEADLRDFQSETRKIDSHYSAWLSNELSKVKDVASYIMFGAGVAVLIGSIFIKLIALGAGIMVLLGLIGGIMMLVNSGTRKRLTNTANRNCANAKEILRQVVTEYGNALNGIREYDNISESILDEFAKI